MRKIVIKVSDVHVRIESGAGDATVVAGLTLRHLSVTPEVPVEGSEQQGWRWGGQPKGGGSLVHKSASIEGLAVYVSPGARCNGVATNETDWEALMLPMLQVESAHLPFLPTSVVRPRHSERRSSIFHIFVTRRHLTLIYPVHRSSPFCTTLPTPLSRPIPFPRPISTAAAAPLLFLFFCFLLDLLLQCPVLSCAPFPSSPSPFPFFLLLAIALIEMLQHETLPRPDSQPAERDHTTATDWL